MITKTIKKLTPSLRQKFSRKLHEQNKGFGCSVMNPKYLIRCDNGLNYFAHSITIDNGTTSINGKFKTSGKLTFFYMESRPRKNNFNKNFVCWRTV